MSKEKIKLICDKCGEKLELEILDKKQIKEKLQKTDFAKKDRFSQGLIIRTIEMGFQYFYCKKCDWGKFVKNDMVEW